MKPSQAIELVSNIEDSNDLLLCGIDGLENASIKFSSARYYNHITDENSVANVFGFGPQNMFFYSILSYRDNNLIRHESGVGYAYKKEDKACFHRHLPIYYGKTIDDKRLIKSDISRYECINDCVNILISSVPQDYMLSFYDKNCIIISKDKFVPIPLQISENSFLARINDNDLSSVSFDDKEFSEIIVESLSRYNKQLSLKSSKLNASKLAVKQLQLEPSREMNVKKGTFIYDELTDTVKFYNGEKWRTLQWVEEKNLE